MNGNCRMWGILVIFSLFFAFIEVSGSAAPVNPDHHVTSEYNTILFLSEEETTTKYPIPGEKGNWEIKITKRQGYKDTIKVKYTPNRNETTCNNICFVQTVILEGYDENGTKVASSMEEIYRDPFYNVFHKHVKDDQIEDNSKIVVVDHLECEGDPFTNGNDTVKDRGIRGSVNPLRTAEFEDTPGISVGRHDKKQNIKEIVQTFEISAVCADTGDILGSIRWKCVSTQTDYGEIELISREEGEPTRAFEKALQKFVENHSRVRLENGVEVTRWYCPETSPIIEGPRGICSDPWGIPIPEEFRERWPTSRTRVEDPCGGTIFLRGVKRKLVVGSRYRMDAGDLGMVKSGKELNLSESEVGGGQYFESPMEALEAGLSDSGNCAIKFTWSGDQTKIIGGILFTSYRAISPEDVSPFIEKEDRFINDFSALDAQFVPTALIEHMLDVMTSYAGPLQSSDGPVTVTLIANVGTEKAAAYTGALLPEDVASFVKEAAMHETVNQELIEVLHYIGLNFGLLLGSVDVPPTEFFINLKKGQPKVVIIVGDEAAEEDVVSATRLAAEINAMVTPEAPDVVVMADAEFNFDEWTVSGDYNLILVGGPVANSITRVLVDEGFSSIKWVISSGEWELIPEPYGNDCDILIVAGEDRDATYSASQQLIQWL